MTNQTLYSYEYVCSCLFHMSQEGKYQKLCLTTLSKVRTELNVLPYTIRTQRQPTILP